MLVPPCSAFPHSRQPFSASPLYEYLGTKRVFHWQSPTRKNHTGEAQTLKNGLDVVHTINQPVFYLIQQPVVL